MCRFPMVESNQRAHEFGHLIGGGMDSGQMWSGHFCPVLLTLVLIWVNEENQQAKAAGRSARSTL